jgi:hypothetical protein
MNTPSDLRSPYLPPSADLSNPLEQLPTLQPHERSGAPKVFGVLSIIFASLVLFSSGLGLLGTAATQAMSSVGASANAEKAAEMAAMAQPLAKVYRGIGVLSGILFVMSAMLLAIGIGQLRYRAWARRWSVYWGGAALGCVVVMVAISLLVISPAYGELFDTLSRLQPQGDGQAGMPPQMSGLTTMFGGMFAVFSVLVYTPYPALMLLFFTRDHVRASMTR